MLKFRNSLSGEIRDVREPRDVDTEVEGWEAQRQAKYVLNALRESKRWTELRGAEDAPKPRAPRKATADKGE
jgi:hypothetical protein